MAKTRSQTGKITIIKKEEEDCKPTNILNGVNIVTKTRAKITKRESSKNNDRCLLAPDIKTEQDTDTKSLLQSASKLPKGKRVSQEQITELISAIVNDKISIFKASLKVKISIHTAYSYYNIYKNDPDKKIPPPRNNCQRVSTKQDIENLIRYVEHDKMSVAKASAKANMCCRTGRYYYTKYLNDPDHNIPNLCHRITEGQRKEFISYIVNDKMTIKAASGKAKMSAESGHLYYHKYFNGQNPDIPTPSHIISYKRHPQERIKRFISYVVDDKMSIKAASKKVNINQACGGKHYRQYLKDNNMEIPVSKFRKRYTQDEVNEFISYIVSDKMTIRAALTKANMSEFTGRKYYRKYAKEDNLNFHPPKYTQDKIDELIGYIVHGKMSINMASKKTNMEYQTAYRYYRKYAKDHNLDMHIRNHITQEQKK